MYLRGDLLAYTDRVEDSFLPTGMQSRIRKTSIIPDSSSFCSQLDGWSIKLSHVSHKKIWIDDLPERPQSPRFRHSSKYSRMAHRRKRHRHRRNPRIRRRPQLYVVRR